MKGLEGSVSDFSGVVRKMIKLLHGLIREELLYLKVWGLKNIFLFSQALAAKGGWRLIKIASLWTQVIKLKYLLEESIEDWI